MAHKYFIPKRTLYLTILLFCTNLGSIRCECFNLDKTIVIRNQESGMVVDGIDPSQIQISYYSDAASKKWKLRPSSTLGAFNIINEANGNALDVLTVTDGDAAITATFTDSANQQWYISDGGHILNRGFSGSSLDIDHSIYEEGTAIWVYPRTENPNQKFILEFSELL